VGPEGAVRAYFETTVTTDAFLVIEVDLFAATGYRPGWTVPLTIAARFAE